MLGQAYSIYQRNLVLEIVILSSSPKISFLINNRNQIENIVNNLQKSPPSSQHYYDKLNKEKKSKLNTYKIYFKRSGGS